jgi:vanillate O-demethylase ferredoxin subunit
MPNMHHSMLARDFPGETAMSAGTDTIEVQITDVSAAADDTRAFWLARTDGAALPAYAPGSHIDVHLPGGLVRQYSLCGADACAPVYRIAVKREPASRGGSAWLHSAAQVGTRLRIGTPRNAFALSDMADRHLLIAGGIGVTPILSMAYALAVSRKPYTLAYFARGDASVVLRAEFERLPLAAHARIHAGLSPAATRDCVGSLLSAAVPGTHLYVCGPQAFMEMTVGLARNLLGEQCVHQESFGPAALAAGDEREFAVRLEGRSNAIPVPAGKTVLACLREAGFEIASSCEVGVCGTCMMRVLAGEPDHRDTYLTDDERAAGTCILPCVSRSKSPVLVLDQPV